MTPQKQHLGEGVPIGCEFTKSSSSVQLAHPTLSNRSTGGRAPAKTKPEPESVPLLCYSF